MLYFLNKAFASIRQRPGACLLASSTIGAALTLSALFFLSVNNVQALTAFWSKSTFISVELIDNLSQKEIEFLANDYQKMPEIKEAAIVTPEMAWARFKAKGPKSAALLEGLEPSILPTTIELFLDQTYPLEKIAELSQNMEASNHVRAVDYGQDEYGQLHELLDVLRRTSHVLGVLLSLMAAFIVANTIGVTIYSRQDEIEVMQRVGATPGFIRAPFLFEGGIWGLFGALMTISLLALADYFMTPHLSKILSPLLQGFRLEFIDVSGILWIGTFGILLGLSGSLFSVSKILGRKV
ncbi:MAG: ABC transporter permease [Myxococcota bacterium]|nr:ABC transporter permease [Myxococcota bacterium]